MPYGPITQRTHTYKMQNAASNSIPWPGAVDPDILGLNQFVESLELEDVLSSFLPKAVRF